MDDKKKSLFDPNIPLILEKEIDNPLVLNKEIDLSQNNKKNEILKIKDLVKLKYLSSEKIEKKSIRDNLVKDFTSIKDSAKKIKRNHKYKQVSRN